MTPQEADALHRRSTIIDAHCDALGNSVYGARRLGRRSETGQFDLPRAREGGLTAELLAIFYDPARAGSGLQQAIRYTDAFYEEAAANQDIALPALRAEDIVRAKAEGKVAMVLTMEGAEALQGDLSALRTMYRLGLRFLGITWNRRNEAADGVGERRAGGGLSEFGVALVKECNRLGIVLDMAHLSPAAVKDVLAISEAPVVVTHGNCYDLWPAAPNITPWPAARNLTSAQMEAIARSGGVVGATAVPAFLGPDEKRAPLSALLDHIDYMVKVVGEDHVGFGMDFEGVRDARVDGMEDVSMLPNLTLGLAERGHSPEAIRKILGENVLRVFRQVSG